MITTHERRARRTHTLGAMAAAGLFTASLAACSAADPSESAGAASSAYTGPLNGVVGYHGGPVLTNVRVVPVFWGNGVNLFVQTSLPSFFSQIVNSPYMDWLAEYSTTLPGGTNQVIGRGTATGAYVIAPTVSRATLTDADIQSELAKQIAAAHLPAPDANTLYMVYFAPGQTITSSLGTSCRDFCAYHQSTGPSTSRIRYAVFPDIGPGSGCDTTCGSASSQWGNVTWLTSAQLLRAVTDPEPGQSWVNSTDASKEVTDTCVLRHQPLQETISTASYTYALATGWSNLHNGCSAGVGPGALVSMYGHCVDVPNPSAPSGLPEMQTCDWTANQQWALSAGRLVGANNTCLNVGPAFSPGYSSVNDAPCNGAANQVWTFANAEVRGYGNKMHGPSWLQYGERHARPVLRLQRRSESAVDLHPCGRDPRARKQVPRRTRVRDREWDASAALRLQRGSQPTVVGEERHDRRLRGQMPRPLSLQHRQRRQPRDL
jgi:hypothetical protein